jgi:hypothetical protein
MAAVMQFEDVLIEGNTLEQMFLRWGITLVQAMRQQQEAHSFASAE